MLFEAALGLTVVIILAYGVDYIFSRFDDPQEPRRVGSTLPVIGHLIGILRHGFDYYSITSKRTDDEIYTIGILNYKIYITQTARVSHLIQRASKTLSFSPFLQVSHRVHGDLTDEGNDRFNDEVLNNFSASTRDTLAPGPHLDAQNLRMGDQSLIEVTDLLESHKEIPLLAWSRHVIMQATSAGLYGVRNPFNDPTVADAMWIWNEFRPVHTFGLDPLRTGYKARHRLFEAFRKYFENVPDDVSMMISEHQRIFEEGGIEGKDTYKMQANFSHAAYPNTAPTLYWVVHEIWSRPELLETIRQEIADNAVQKSADSFILDVAALKTKCHVLLSAYQETQRTRHTQVAFRMVTQDTLIDDKWMLKKGNMIHMPAKPTHDDPEVWGPNAQVFDPYRFVPAKPGETKAKILPSTFLPWGAPPHLCPARQFVTTEILIVVALLAMRINLTPLSKKGWERNPALKPNDIASLPRPQKDVHLRVTPRAEGAGRWAVIVGESRTRLSLASG
ncbi:cytochrome P450 [Xylariales sp. PMI_506]|nr:cytochrome P450 [Xylariales sp. PMI_506]